MLTAGSVLCDVTSPVSTATRFRARIVIFNINFPITKGFPVSVISVSVLSLFFITLFTDIGKRCEREYQIALLTFTTQFIIQTTFSTYFSRAGPSRQLLSVTQMRLGSVQRDITVVHHSYATLYLMTLLAILMLLHVLVKAN